MYYSEYDAFLEGYSDALLEMEEDNNYEDTYLEGYYTALMETRNVAKDMMTKKHLTADIASGLVPFTNTTQAIRANKFKNNKGYLNSLYNDYVEQCEKQEVKPMPKDEFIKKTKKFYERRRIGKAIAIGTDVTVGLKPVAAVINGFQQRDAYN